MWIGKIKERIENQKDCWLLIEGETGSGKTTFAVILAYLLNKKYGLKFSEKNYFVGIKPFLKSKIGRKNVYIIDEISADLNAGSWNSKMNKLFRYYSATQRILQNVYILISPFRRLISTVNYLFFKYIILADRGFVNVQEVKVDYNTQTIRLDLVKLLHYDLEEFFEKKDFRKLYRTIIERSIKYKEKIRKEILEEIKNL